MNTQERADKSARQALLKKLMRGQVFFNKLILPDMFGLPVPDFHRLIYQPLSDSDISILVVLMPRGFAKTTILQAYLLQQVVHKTHKTIAYVADTQPQAERHTEMVREELEINEKIIQLYGVQQGKRKWGSTLWTTTGGVSVMPFGSNQSMRGLKVGKDRPSLIIIDDFENDENVETPEQRDKLWKRLFAVIKPMLRSGGSTKIVYLGTAVHEDCILYRLMDLLRNNPAPHICVVEQGAKYDNGQSVWPELKSTEELNEEERLYAEAGQLDTFYQEYYCKVIASKDASFPKDRAVYYSEKDTPDDCRTWMALDFAMSKSKSADYCAAVVFSTSMSAKSVLVREAIRSRMKPNEFLALLVQLNKTYRPLRVYVQSVMLDEFFQFYANECDTRLPFEKVKISQKRNAKMRRIASLEPLYIGGRLQFQRRHTDILGELWMHPRSKHDDLSDALATGVSKVRIPAVGKIEQPELVQGSFEFILRMNELAQKSNKPNMGLTYMPPVSKWEYH